MTTYKKYAIAISIFMILLGVVNMFLLQKGIWLNQDATYWYKNIYEARYALADQTQAFSHYGYYYGFDRGLLTYTRVVPIAIANGLIWLFGSEIAQVLFTLGGYILSFVAFYLFSGIFFRDKRIRYVISLIYVFNPFMISLQGFTIIYAGIPLFLYTTYMYLQSMRIRFVFLLLNVLASFLIISYIRFIGISAVVIVPFFVYIILSKKIHLKVKKLGIAAIVYLITLSPVLYSATIQIIEGSDTAFHFASVLGTIASHDFYTAFNIIRTYDIVLHDNAFYLTSGLTLFAYVLFLTVKKEKLSYFSCLNILLILFGFSLYSLRDVYGAASEFVVKIFPFVYNSSFWALFIGNIPLVLLVGDLTKQNKKLLYIFASFFILLSVYPLLNLSNIKLQKAEIEKVPTPYKEYFLKNQNDGMTASHYIPRKCWEAEYMKGQPLHCINFGHKYTPIQYDNPRYITGNDFQVSEKTFKDPNYNNLVFSHNLKKIFVANDLQSVNVMRLENSKAIRFTEREKEKLENLPIMEKTTNPNFNIYSLKDSDKYDFRLYSPSTVYRGSADTHIQNNIPLNPLPVLLTEEVETKGIKSAHIFYKSAKQNPTKFLLKISDLDDAERVLIQLNQSYGRSWKLYYITPEQFAEKKCINSVISTDSTNNSSCTVKDELLSPEDIFLSKIEQVPESNHMRGNLLGNAWILEIDTLRKHNSEDGSMYAMILYEKQSYLSATIILSLGGALFLLVISCIQEYRRLKKVHG